MKKILLKIKENELALLYIIFGVALVVSNCIGSKLFQLPFQMFGAPVVLTVGTIVYPITFLITDIIGEKYGKDKALIAVIGGFIGQVFACIIIIIAQYLPAISQASQDAYVAQLGQSFIFVIASLTAYVTSQIIDVNLFHAIKNKYLQKHGKITWFKWIYNNIATITSQFFDTAIYVIIAFGIGFNYFAIEGGLLILLNMFIVQWIIKAILALLDTPIFIFFTKQSKKREGEEK